MPRIPQFEAEKVETFSKILDEQAASVSALTGERGVYMNMNGTISTEKSITVIDPRLNNGMPTNIPTLVMGQDETDLEVWLNEEPGNVPSDVMHRVQERAIDRAVKRVEQGQELPFYQTVQEAEEEAQRRSSVKDKNE